MLDRDIANIMADKLVGFGCSTTVRTVNPTAVIPGSAFFYTSTLIYNESVIIYKDENVSQGNLEFTPVVGKTVMFHSQGKHQVKDDGAGHLTGHCKPGGYINYLTGAYHFEWSSPILLTPQVSYEYDTEESPEGYSEVKVQYGRQGLVIKVYGECSSVMTIPMDVYNDQWDILNPNFNVEKEVDKVVNAVARYLISFTF